MKPVCLVILLFGLLVSATSSSTDEPANRVRQTRGFKNSALATARGFGKRTMLNDLVDSTDRAIMSNEQLADLMSRNPQFAQQILTKFVDTDGDGVLSFRELFPEE
uniref:EF-hand domain-containing protein n=1 Tax=Strigamia maritima TaxID=126957 RepID=T1JMF8_STRMM